MFVVHDLAGRYWNGVRFSCYYAHTAKRFVSFKEASTLAEACNAVVGDY